MPDIETVSTWEGRILLDRDGGRIGTEERQLWRHYDLDYDTTGPGTAQVERGRVRLRRYVAGEARRSLRG